MARHVTSLTVFCAITALSLTLAGVPFQGATRAAEPVAASANFAVAPQAAPGQFLESFDGAPASPQTWSNPNNWDITPTGLNTQQNGATAQVAHHGPACDPPGFPYNSANTHPITGTGSQVFICNNHLMTANGLTGYGAVYMVPPAMADFSGGSSTIQLDMSTLRTASRDWVYFTLAPFEGHNKFAYNGNDQAVPADNINIKMEGTNAFSVSQRVGGGSDVSIEADSGTTWDMVQAANGVSESAARRDTIRIELSATHLRVCITGNNLGQTYTYQGKLGFCWVDHDLNTPLAPSVWGSRATFLITHVSYNPEKSCSAEEDQFFIVHNATGDAQCPPNTWHWDNVSINPATPFTIVNPQQQFASFANPSGANTVTLARPAPAGAKLSFIAAGACDGQRFSVDGGATWIKAIPQPTTTQCQHPENGGEYWTPIPEGATSVKFTGEMAFGAWSVGGIAIWAGGGTLPPLTQQPPVAPPAQAPATPSFHSAWVDQSAYPTIAPGETATVTLRFRNSGQDAWQTGVPGRQVNLGVAGDSTAFSDLGMANGWLSANRLATSTEAVVPAGVAGTFRFQVRAPTATGIYRIPLRLVADGVAWLEDQGVYIVVTSDYGYHSAWASQSAWPTLRAGQVSGPLSVAFRNTGTKPWVKGQLGQANLGIADDDSSFTGLAAGWPSPNRVAAQSEPSVPPGAIGTFVFQARAPSTPGVYRLSLRPVIDGVTWLEDEGVFLQVTVVP